jgi:glycosyltransferase involved in cell wall biosynthesis
LGAYRIDMIVADGGSTDGTRAIARTAGARVIDAGRAYGHACALSAIISECWAASSRNSGRIQLE